MRTREQTIPFLVVAAALLLPVAPIPISVSSSPATKCASSAVRLKGAGQTSDYGILRSVDRGKTWTKVVNDSGAIQTIAEVSARRVWAGTNAALQGPKMEFGLLRSDDEGSKWIRSSSCPGGIDLSDIRSIISVSEGHLLAAGGRGVFCSDDGGESWVGLNGGLISGAGSNVQSLANHGQGVVLAATYDGVSRSDQYGPWKPAGPRGVPVNVVAISPKGTILAGSGGKGIYRSTDLGVTWKPIIVTSGRVWVSTIVTDPKGTIFAGISDHGVYRSDDDGISWKQLHIPGKRLQVFALATSASGDLYAATSDCCPAQEVSLSRSSDSGSTWSTILELHEADVAIGSVAVTATGTILVGLNWVGE